MNGHWRASRLQFEWWLIAVLVSVTVVAFSIDRTLLRIDNLIYDYLIRLDRNAPSDQILLVAIDDESLRRVGRWPWPRETHARLIRALGQAGPSAIGYDVLFSEPASPQGDDALGAAISEVRRVFVPLSFVVPGRNGAAVEAIYPIPPVRDAAAGIGHVNLTFDPDGVVRRTTLSYGDHRQRWPHLMDLLRSTVDRHPPQQAIAEQESQLIPYAGSAGHWPTLSAASILAGEVPAEFLRDRIILVGATAEPLGDRYAVSAGALMPGVEIQAHLLDGLLSGRMLTETGRTGLILFGLLPLACLLLAYRILPRRAAPVCVAALITTVLLASALFFIVFRIWIPPAAALAGLTISYPLWAWRQLASADAFMRAELARFRAEPAVLPSDGQPWIAGRIDSTIRMLRQAIANARDLRHFIADRLDQLPDATLVADLSGRVLLTNTAAVQLFDSLGVAAGQREDIGMLLSSFKQSVTGEPFASPKSAGEGGGGDEHFHDEATTDDGRYFSIRFAVQTSSAGDHIGWIVRITDISEAKAAQRQKDDIVQLLTHDMRSPQASIMAVLETAAPDQIDGQVSARIRHYVQRTLGLADGFVQLARAEAMQYALEEVDVGDMLMDAIDDLWPQLTVKNIAIRTVGEDQQLVVLGERSLLTRALANVIGNAIKYSDCGTTITCTLERMVAADGRLVACCAIADQGQGLAPEHGQLIFERFHRAPMAIDRKVDGVGLGLSFVHTVMVRHRGEIRCDSEPDRGSTFTFTLPLVA